MVWLLDIRVGPALVPAPGPLFLVFSGHTPFTEHVTQGVGILWALCRLVHCNLGSDVLLAEPIMFDDAQESLLCQFIVSVLSILVILTDMGHMSVCLML